jgi:hypothetical protein
MQFQIFGDTLSQILSVPEYFQRRISAIGESSHSVHSVSQEPTAATPATDAAGTTIAAMAEG